MTTTSIPALLEPIQERLNKATPGPWDWDHSNFRRVLEGKDGEQVLTCAALLYPERRNQEFIANAPTDTARLLAAVKAVTEVHEPVDAVMNPGRHERVVKVCTGCGADDGNWQRFPCPTIRAVEAALRGEA
ncbi:MULTISPECIES: hypothetical protein [Paenarthrobacter]|uniref:Uncharacterized protein n=1 Tax=Paenarthrobacter ureafaciens TaxID=37931 RepID=A0AAX3EGT0_PAEUR|nr:MULTISPECIES: hypothetical protein [Paenarthrobacter]MDO5866006.1 hypothetical protein [Paenarthrobacter sp. SD-2]MDO5877101.1 hypothetical protein [Paenarthrobacter sp. SD-1]UYV92303.1 hypothetical protein NL395_17540 [Paenarthrobacter ureafaciens]UYV96838.1 hypothetical protein NL394_17570 [Paenarthrobacter ureafaciens]